MEYRRDYMKIEEIFRDIIDEWTKKIQTITDAIINKSITNDEQVVKEIDNLSKEELKLCAYQFIMGATLKKVEIKYEKAQKQLKDIEQQKRNAELMYG